MPFWALWSGCVEAESVDGRSFTRRIQMKTEQIGMKTDWRSEWFEFDDVAYMDTAGQAALPKVAIRAAQSAIEWKKYPHKMPEDNMFALPARVRELLAEMIGAQAAEIALTAGASTGMAAVAQGVDWKPGDEVLIARGEFPAHVATWLPMQAAGRLKVRIISPRGRFLTTDDLIDAITPNTRLISTSLVRFDDGARCDGRRIADAIHKVGGMLLLDVAQCVGALPMNVTDMGADFLAASGYKWLLGPYGTGFYWASANSMAALKPMPAYWTAIEGSSNFSKLTGEMRLKKEACRWDMPETANFFNLAPLQASLEFLARVGVKTVWEHNAELMAQIIERLPLDKCVLASPADPNLRGPYVCVAARHAAETPKLYEKLRAAGVIVSLREGALRIAPHLYNTELDVDRLIAALTT
jgi:cysteine desulfurase / selenocysteine lyase